MIPNQWFIRKTTHGFSTVAHSIIPEIVDEIYTVLICNLNTKHRLDKLVEVNDDYPKKCPFCIKKISQLVQRRLLGKQEEIFIGVDPAAGHAGIWGY